MHLNKTLLKDMRNQIQAKLDELELGVEFTIGNCSFGEGHATFQLKVQVEGQDTKEMSDLKQIASYRKLDLDKTYQEGSHLFKLVGYKSRSRKNPFVVQDIKTNKEYVIADSVASKWFGKPMDINVVDFKPQANVEG